MEKCIIVAVADNMAIGKDNALLWHIAEDMKFFRRTTTGNPVIMGYKTFLSIGAKPLPKRMNIVISRRAAEEKEAETETLKFVASLEEAYELAEKHLGESGQVFVMGGGKTYAQALPAADKLYVTHVHTEIADADTFFPAIDPAEWERESFVTPEQPDPETGYSYEFAVYRRR